MPPIETDCRTQKAVLWANSGSYSGDGEPTVSEATEIDVRWEEIQEQVTDSNSNSISITSKVVVNQDVAIGSILWLGALDDIASPPVNLKQVVSFPKIPDIKGRKFRRVLLLKKYGNTLPEIV